LLCRLHFLLPEINDCVGRCHICSSPRRCCRHDRNGRID
jgi:hypothetical protein